MDERWWLDIYGGWKVSVSQKFESEEHFGSWIQPRQVGVRKQLGDRSIRERTMPTILGTNFISIRTRSWHKRNSFLILGISHNNFLKVGLKIDN